jgi:hypothetical protein
MRGGRPTCLETLNPPAIRDRKDHRAGLECGARLEGATANHHVRSRRQSTGCRASTKAATDPMAGIRRAVSGSTWWTAANQPVSALTKTCQNGRAKRLGSTFRAVCGTARS